jgi:hypothetical protein
MFSAGGMESEYKAKLESLYSELGSTIAVGQALGFSSEKIRKDMHRLGLKMHKQGGRIKFVYDVEELRALYQAKTAEQIAEQYGVGATTVWAALYKHGITHDLYGDGGHKRKKRQFSAKHLEACKKAAFAKRGKYVGENSPTWKGGVMLANLRARGSKDYRNWRTAALHLRGDKCQDCGTADGHECGCCGTRVKLHVHHLFSFAEFPEKRFDPENSEVLCPKCHYRRHYRKSGELLETPESPDNHNVAGNGRRDGSRMPGIGQSAA